MFLALSEDAMFLLLADGDVLTAFNWVGVIGGLAALIAAVYAGVAQLRKISMDGRVAVKKTEGEEEREDRAAGMGEYAKAVEEWRRLTRVYETRIKKLEDKDTIREGEYNRMVLAEQRCQRTLTLVLDRLASHEDALTNAKIPFRALRNDPNIRDMGLDFGEEKPHE